MLSVPCNMPLCSCHAYGSVQQTYSNGWLCCKAKVAHIAHNLLYLHIDGSTTVICRAVMLNRLMMLMTHTNLAALCTSNLVSHHPQCRCSYSHQPVAEEARSPLLSDLH